jgi:hypothetical protein
VLCFFPDGTIAIAFINIPGVVHDSQVADYGDIYEKLKFVFDRDGAKCIVNSAFGNVTRDFLIKSSQELIHIEIIRREILRAMQLRCSSRQSGGCKRFNPHIKDRMKFETRGEWKVTLMMMILLYNLWAQTVGINQLLSFYAGPLHRNTNIEFVLPLLNN